jgi:threonine dehydratase
MDLILEARRALEGRIRRTPIEESSALSEAVGVPVSLKLESLQLTGSFKIRGAFFRLLSLSPEERRTGVVTCSAGNHGKAVAHVARELGIPATIYVPRSVDESKYQGILSRGAEVVRSEFDGFDETEALARDHAAQTGRPYVSAYDEERILAANGGTLAAEVLEDAPSARSFLLPVGGAGLSGGFAYYAKARLPGARLVCCQHADSPALALSLEKGEAITRLPPVATTAGGLEGGIGRTGFEVLKSRIDAVALVTEEDIFDAVRFMLAEHQYLIEPSSAVTVAAIRTGKALPLSGPAVAVISGRNVALSTIRRILA